MSDPPSDPEPAQRLEDAADPRASIAAQQTTRLRRLLAKSLASNAFYQNKLGELGLRPATFELPSLCELPLTTKQELVVDQRDHPPYGTNLAEPIESYVRLHQTSGTSGSPLRWLDTPTSWRGFLGSWRLVLEACGVRAEDRVFVAFSFGPFIGFWGAFEAAQQLGALTLSGGGLDTGQRLRQIVDHDVTVLISTPTYALRLAETARSGGIDLGDSSIRVTLHAGEPGASVPAVRDRLAAAFGADVFDHAGATEIGAWGYPGRDGRMLIDETRFVAELIDPETARPLELGKEPRSGELVLTSLERIDSPVIRYRTGDLVQLALESDGGRRAYLAGGVLGRVDDMFVVRGVNVYPSAIENIVRQVDDIGEFRALVTRREEMTELELEIECTADRQDDSKRQLERLLRERLSLRVGIRPVDPGSLPRFELKARRFVFD